MAKNYPYIEPINPNPKLERQIDRARRLGVCEELIQEAVHTNWSTTKYPHGPYERIISGTYDIRMISDIEDHITDRKYEIDNTRSKHTIFLQRIVLGLAVIAAIGAIVQCYGVFLDHFYH